MADEEDDERGRKKRTMTNRLNKRGIPQGALISPLLSNLYMRRFILGWKQLGYEQAFGASIVNYADDLVICCRREANDALTAMRQPLGAVTRRRRDEPTWARSRRRRVSGA